MKSLIVILFLFISCDAYQTKNNRSPARDLLIGEWVGVSDISADTVSIEFTKQSKFIKDYTNTGGKKFEENFHFLNDRVVIAGKDSILIKRLTEDELRIEPYDSVMRFRKEVELIYAVDFKRIH